jgi:hypothetical protein
VTVNLVRPTFISIENSLCSSSGFASRYKCIPSQAEVNPPSGLSQQVLQLGVVGGDAPEQKGYVVFFAPHLFFVSPFHNVSESLFVGVGPIVFFFF